MANSFEIEGRIVAHDEATVVIEGASRNMAQFSRDTRTAYYATRVRPAGRSHLCDPARRK